MRKATEQRILRGIGARIGAIRKAAGLTQEDAAHRARIDYKRWQRLERGDVNPTVRTLLRAATALGVDLSRLFGSS